MLTSLTPMLRTKQIKETIDFYVQILGFTCEHFSEESGWAYLQKDTVQLMLASENEHMPFDNCSFTGSLYFNTTNANSVWEQLKNKVKICYPIEDFEYGMREFAIFDNNGYLLQFGENINDE